MTLYLMAAVVFAALLLLGLAVAAVVGGGGDRARSLEYVRQYGGGRVRPPQQAGRGDGQPKGAVAQVALRTADRALGKEERRRRVAADLDHAALSLKPQEWLVLRACVAVVAVLVLAFVLPLPLAVLGGALVGWLGTRAYLRMRTARRRRAFDDALVDTLQLVAGSLRSGFSLAQALDAAAREGSGPMAVELSRALAEARVGAQLEDSLGRVAQRMASEDFEWVVMAIRIQREVGGNLGEILLTTAATLRERAFLARHVKALSAEGRLSGYILIALPIFLGLWMFMSQRDYVSVLWTTGLGVLMLIGIGVMITVGWFWMSKTVKVTV